jgi:hypothetical protein
MIHSNPHPLAEDQARRISEWLRQPGFRDFVAWLADRAAFYTAEAGKSMVEGGDSDKIEAETAAAKARTFRDAHAIMVGTMDPEFKFEAATLTPKPLTIT